MILITGGAGVMGRRLTVRMIQKGHPVRVLALPGDAGAAELAKRGAEVMFGDVTDKESIRDAMKDVDTVFHMAAIILSPLHPERFQDVNYQGTVHLLSLSEEYGIKHFIYLSSASVIYPKSNAYARSKKAAEDAVRHSRIPHYTIIRPTLAYETGGGIEFMHFVRHLLRFPVVFLIGNGSALKSPVYVEDIINGLVQIPGNEKSYGKTYNFSGGERISMEKMAQTILAAIDRKKPILKVPVFICRIIAVWAKLLSVLNGKPTLLTWQTISGVTQNADLDNSEAAADLDYSPRGFGEGIRLVEFNNV